MLPFMTNFFGNASSRTHAYGWETEKAVEEARAQVASLIGADAKDIIFTSGATESNNTALKGVARFYKDKKNHIITTQTVRHRDPDPVRVLTWRHLDPIWPSLAVFDRSTNAFLTLAATSRPKASR